MQLILVINRRTRIEYYANKFSTLIFIKPLSLILHGLCFLGVKVFAIECIRLAVKLGCEITLHVRYSSHAGVRDYVTYRSHVLERDYVTSIS